MFVSEAITEKFEKVNNMMSKISGNHAGYDNTLSGPRVRIAVYFATGLPNVEKNLLAGLTDPYVKINVGKTTKHTMFLNDNLNPIWLDAFDFAIPHEDVDIEFELWDKSVHPLEKIVIHDKKFDSFKIKASDLEKGINHFPDQKLSVGGIAFSIEATDFGKDKKSDNDAEWDKCFNFVCHPKVVTSVRVKGPFGNQNSVGDTELAQQHVEMQGFLLSKQGKLRQETRK